MLSGVEWNSEDHEVMIKNPGSTGHVVDIELIAKDRRVTSPAIVS